MLQTFVHCAELQFAAEADPASAGGAVTLALCGSWDHPGPCRWPHEAATEIDQRTGRVRVVFLATEDEETHVRTLIDQALSGGECVAPDGSRNCWNVTALTPTVPTGSDAALGAKIAGEQAARYSTQE